MADALIEWIEPVRARREQYAGGSRRGARIIGPRLRQSSRGGEKYDVARARSGLRLGEAARESAPSPQTTTRLRRLGRHGYGLYWSRAIEVSD